MCSVDRRLQGQWMGGCKESKWETGRTVVSGEKAAKTVDWKVEQNKWGTGMTVVSG